MKENKMQSENIYVRTKEQQNINKDYIKNIKQSLYKIFIPYFHRHLNLSFRNMLKAQHKKIVNNTYAGYTNPIDKIPDSLIRDEININLRNPLLKKEWYSQELKKLNPSINGVITIKTQGIPKHMWHCLKNTESGLKLYLPENKYVKYYINNMKLIMEILRSGKISLDLLGYYVQLGVICHPFEKVNFSLIMSQVNYILDLWGYSPINHKYLDFECFLNPTEIIINRFKKRVNNESNKI